MNLPSRSQVVWVAILSGVLGYSIALAVESYRAAEADENDSVSLDGVPHSVQATILAELLKEAEGIELAKLERGIADDANFEVQFKNSKNKIELEIDSIGGLVDKNVGSNKKKKNKRKGGKKGRYEAKDKYDDDKYDDDDRDEDKVDDELRRNDNNEEEADDKDE